LALADLRCGDGAGSRYRRAPDPDRLLADEFTLRQLRLAHEAIGGVALQRGPFRRAMESRLVATGTTIAAARGRPAELFRRRTPETSRF
jgi:8-oxo-dGTP diphosphatase